MACVFFFGDVEISSKSCLCKPSVIFFQGCMATSSGMYAGRGVCCFFRCTVSLRFLFSVVYSRRSSCLPVFVRTLECREASEHVSSCFSAILGVQCPAGYGSQRTFCMVSSCTPAFFFLLVWERGTAFELVCVSALSLPLVLYAR